MEAPQKALLPFRHFVSNQSPQIRNALSSLRVICAMTNQSGGARNHHHKLMLIEIDATMMSISMSGIMGTPATVGTRVQPLKSGNGLLRCSSITERA